MKFIVDDACYALGLRAGALVFRDIHVTAASAELRREIAEEIVRIRARFLEPKAVRSLPEVEHFREILRQVGVNPKKDQPSLERLLTFALKWGDLPGINSLVDAYNLVSIRWYCSLGAHDLDKIALPVVVRPLTGKETFIPLNGTTPAAVVPGEFGYVDAQDRVLCRLDILQAEFSKVTNATVNALLIVEATAGHSLESLQKAYADAVDVVARYCGGRAELIAPVQPGA
jgi:DNA/RNA-binding domain of Phe-tRNA-synthetase-like protein